MITSEDQLEELLTRPTPALLGMVQAISSPLVVLGAGGKMGPTLAVSAKRAAEAAGHDLRVVAVSRFSNAAARAWLEKVGVETISADLFEREALAKLPDASDVVYLVGQKFGTSQNPSLTWAANTLPPAHAVERYPQARMVALSTGNVYPLVPVASGGATEEHQLTPLGEYANAAVARERIFEWAAQRQQTRLTLVRLNYAVELRYGVLRDMADAVWAGRPVDLANGHLNCLWQGDANEMILRLLPLTRNPPLALNLTGSVRSVREIATALATHLGKPVIFAGTESESALLSNPSRCVELLGEPATAFDDVLRWTAEWVKRGGRSLGKPTHFEVRDGAY